MLQHVSLELLKKAIKFHGHLGPFLVLGLRMGLIAEEKLRRKPRKCVVRTVMKKPYLCAVDGVRVALGDPSVEIKESNGLAIEFVGVDGEKVEVKVKSDLVEKYAKAPWEKCEEYAYEVLNKDDHQLFE